MPITYIQVPRSKLPRYCMLQINGKPKISKYRNCNFRTKTKEISHISMKDRQSIEKHRVPCV